MVDLFVNFFQDLFNVDGFPARWVCGRWTPFHGWLYILSSLAIWLAYFAIPLLLYLFVRQKKNELPFDRIVWLFIVFIFACGTTHLADSVMFWIPAYRVSASILFFTAIISWAAVISLYKLLPRLLALKSPAQIEIMMQKKFEDLTTQLRISEERWQFALEGSQLGVWDWDLKNNKVFFSERWKKMLGYADQELNNTYQTWEDKIHPEDKEVVLAKIKKRRQGQKLPYKIEHRLQCKDGSYKWILTSGMVTSWAVTGEAERMVGTHEDVHGNKVFQERLRVSENTFSSAFHFSGIGIAFVSPEGYWKDVNPALCLLLGYSREELLKMTFQEITHPDDLELDLIHVRQMLTKEINSYQIEKRYFHKNGQIVWASLTVSMVWDTTGKPQFFISQIVDITQTKDLINVLENKNETLQVTALDLEGKINQLEEFSQIVAHNLRGPAGNIQMLLKMLPSEMPEATDHAYYSMLMQSSENLLETLNDLMRVVEIRLNRDIQFTDCNLEEIINNVLLSFTPQIMNKGAIVECDLKSKILNYPKIYLDSIIYNLISNALKYTRENIKPVIKISTSFENNRMVLKVKDNGLGIDLNKYGNRVFKFKKIFHSGFDSKGVGLFMTKNQIESFGGSIEVESKPMEGCEFSVRF